MNKKLLYKHLDNYLSKVNLDNDFNDLKERFEIKPHAIPLALDYG